MSIDELRAVLTRLGYKISDDRFVVPLPADRSQTIHIRVVDDVVQLMTPVASARVVEDAGKRPVRLMELNRYSELVQYAIDGRGRWVATTTLHASAARFEEVGLHVRALAAAADRLEQSMSGQDLY